MSRLRSVIAAAVLAAAATVLPGVSVAPASAAACTDAGGITVVVDRGSLSGPLSQTCVASNGGTAAGLFAQAGHSLERVQRFPGAVCKVNGAPESANCVNMPPANAYWGLFWSNGTSGTWVYSSQGVDNLAIPAGGSVAFAWQNSTSRRNPAVAPPDHDASEPGGGGSGGTGGGSGSGSGGTGDGAGGSTGGSAGGGQSGRGSSEPSATGEPSGRASTAPGEHRTRQRDREPDGDKPARDRERQPRASESAEPTDEATVLPGEEGAGVAAASSESIADDGLPLWLVGLVAAGLLVVGTVVAVVRRTAARGADGGA